MFEKKLICSVVLMTTVL